MKFKVQTSKGHAMTPEHRRRPPAREVYLRFVENKAEEGRDFMTVFLFSTFTVITSVHHTCLHLHGAVFRRNGEGVRGVLIYSDDLHETWSMAQKYTFNFLSRN